MSWKEKFLPFFPFQEKELKAIWRIDRGGFKGFLAGTAHFFRYPLTRSLQSYIRDVQYVLFEGPLDEGSMSEVREHGRASGGAEVIYEALDPHTIKKIDALMAPLFHQNSSLLLLNPLGPPVSDLLFEWFKSHRPWLAFFEIWAQFLRTQGWKYSVDMEALAIATRLKKEVHFMETIPEQIAAMEGIPVERIVHFLEKIDSWEEYSRRHLGNYLEGNIEAMMGGSREYPTRCPSIVDRRDPLFFERMKPFFEKGKTMALVGTIHIPGLKERFLAEGYTLEQVRSKPE